MIGIGLQLMFRYHRYTGVLSDRYAVNSLFGASDLLQFRRKKRAIVPAQPIANIAIVFSTK
jgi:hypothetical protein